MEYLQILNIKLILVLIVGFITISLNSQNVFGDPGDTITTVDASTNDVGKYTFIAIGVDGNPVISYFDSTTEEFKFVHCTNSTCTTKDTPIILDTVGDVRFPASIAIGSDNLPVVSYYDRTNGALKVVHCSTIDCSTFNPTPCMVPSSGPWVISQSCVYYSFGENIENITITNNSLLTIDGTWLGFDFKNYGITVEQGSGLLIKNPGRIALLD